MLPTKKLKKWIHIYLSGLGQESLLNYAHYYKKQPPHACQVHNLSTLLFLLSLEVQSMHHVLLILQTLHSANDLVSYARSSHKLSLSCTRVLTGSPYNLDRPPSKIPLANTTLIRASLPDGDLLIIKLSHIFKIGHH